MEKSKSYNYYKIFILKVLIIGDKKIKSKSSSIIENQHKVDERLLSSKIWYFIETAIYTNFVRATSDKRQNSHKFVDPKEAIFFKNMESINENLQLK